MVRSTQPLMMDVDTGVDDAAALALAVGLHANLVGVTSVAGNVPIDQATDNTLRVLSFLGQSSVPVYRGASRPLAATYQDAAHVHGENGLGDVQLAASAVLESEMTGPEAIISMAQEYAGELVLVMVGPLTDLAIALSLRPRLTRQIARLVIMGGAYFTPGNVTKSAEFNIYVDPDAANQVFSAPWNDITAIGLDVSHQTAITQSIWDGIPQDAQGAAALIRKIAGRTFTTRVRSGFFLHDPLALAVALDPTLVSGRRYAITVSTNGEVRGQTTVIEGGTVLVATEVEAERFVRRFCETLGLPYVEDVRGLINAE
jgi:inosine-uridine nucleoside N-ribohydrolase